MSYKKLIYVTISILAVIMLMVFISRKKDDNISSNKVNIKDISNDSYKIFFDKPGGGVSEDGTVREIYSIVSDGTLLKFEKNETSEKWWEEAGESGIHESMGHFDGEFKSPDEKKELVVKTGLLGTDWFAFFTTPKLYVMQDNKKRLLWDSGLGEAQWLPDSKRVILGASDGGIVIIDVETDKYGYLTKEDGWMFKIKNNK